ncbi:hypothetical protein ACEN8I_23415 [Polaromonas sp. CT11-55]|uniref:hypothetical protein n=1 Tax=Polaromonas sp. CT11-55 TaxID=3243045 RepID=UPI0039A5EE5E
MEPIELSALGATGSAFLAALAYWAKTNHERRRMTRTVLYYLLELHHVVNRVNMAMSSIESVLMAEMRRSLSTHGLTFNEDDEKETMKLALPYIARFAYGEIEGAVTEGSGDFNKALTDLARENPVLAFRLRGRDRVAVLGAKLEDFVQAASAQSGQANPTDDEFAHFNQVFLKLSAEELKSAIRATAWGCDLITHFKVWRLLRATQDETSSQDLKDVVNMLVNEYVSSIAKSTSPQVST